MAKPSLIISPNSEEISKKLLELKEQLDKLNATLRESEVKKCTKKCIEVIDIAGDLDVIFGKR